MICTGCKKDKPESEFWRDNRRNRKMSRCRACKREYMRGYRKRRPDMDKDRYWKDPDSEQERHLIRKYGITLADYGRIFTEQLGKCAVCQTPHDGGRRFDVDHDHKTGIVRGLLCTSCNRMIGHAGDNPSRLVAASEYLQSSRKSPPSS